MPVTTEIFRQKNAAGFHSHCLFCGEENPQSLKLSFRTCKDGGVETRFRPSPVLQGYDGILHGGITASLLDAAMTHCLLHSNIRGVTADLHTRYVHPVPCSVWIDIRAWIVSGRQPLYRLKSEITMGTKILAWANAKFIAFSNDVFFQEQV